MADQSTSKPPHSFGQPTSSNSGTGLFGSKASSAPTTGGLFGSAVPAPGGTGGTGLFGTSKASSAPVGSLFGSNAGGPAASSPVGGTKAGSNMFGDTSKLSAVVEFNFGPSTTTNPPSGGQAGQTTSGAPSGSLFSTPSKLGDAGATSKSALGAASGGGGLFGSKSSNEVNTTTPTSKPITPFFGNSTTPAGPPPAASTGAGSGSLNFSKPESQLNAPSGSAEASFTKSSTPSIFASSGAPSINSSTSQNSQAPSQGSNIFGASSVNANVASGLFGSKSPQAQSEPTNDLQNNKPNQPQDVAPSNTNDKKSSQGLVPNLGRQPTTTTASINAPTQFSSTLKQPQPSAASSPSPFVNLASSNINAGGATPTASTDGQKISFPPSLGNPQFNPTNTTTSSSSSGVQATSATASTIFGAQQKPSTPLSVSESQAPAKTATIDASKSSTTNLGASTTGPVPPARSRLKDKTMDDIITRWASDLSKYQKDFQTQAEKVASWDRILVENSEKIQRLYGSTLEAERATTEVERQLTSVESDQAELESWLNHYEAEVDNMIQSQVGKSEGLSGPDQERERTYQLATRLSDRLEDMGKDLSSMIEEINDASSNLSKHTKTDDPLTQVVRVLNGHLTQLQQIDQGTAKLQLKVKEAQRAGQSIRPPNGLNGPSSDAAEAFYRSFMGRG